MKQRLALQIRGLVQGVGFRPFIYRLATEMNLSGWVLNSSQGVFLEVEGAPEALRLFQVRIESEKPPHSSIHGMEPTLLDPVGYTSFEVRPSLDGGSPTALILPDIATCTECLQEIFDPADRRYMYPFTNCTHCGPRFTIIQALPYDRANTTMSRFVMCPRCQAEYDNPSNRRFHAQPNACPHCGPTVTFMNAKGAVISTGSKAMDATVQSIRAGNIVAVKGLGGYHLMVDASNNDAVLRLRKAKGRDEKPFAMMAPSMDWVRKCCTVSQDEERLLKSPEAPIVLLDRSPNPQWFPASDVAPDNPCLGVMLPSNPLHHILMHTLGVPIIATSGNVSEEPICIDNDEARSRLAGIADFFLDHNRPIVRHVDDSVARVMLGREMVLRRSRGYAPYPIFLSTEPDPVLAVGAHLKNTVALPAGGGVCISQHIGDLSTSESYQAFQRVAEDLQRMYNVHPTAIACDLHPDYLSTRFARSSGLPVIAVQHHYAHALSTMAENRVLPPALAVTWDGTGLGTDETIWGGEFLRISENTFDRVAHFRTFPLPGGEKAIHEPSRTALGLLYEMMGDEAFVRQDLLPVQVFDTKSKSVIHRMLSRSINCPRTSSVGRLIDAVASLLGLNQKMAYEGQAAMKLEFATTDARVDSFYTVNIRSGVPSIIDWEPMIRELVDDQAAGVPLAILATKVHNSLTEIIVAIAQQNSLERIALCGGCFQNRYLTERTVRRLQGEGFRPYWSQRVPPNDGGIALGQIFAATRSLHGVE